MNLNPFDLRGPEFLVFYMILAGMTVLGVWVLRRMSESGAPGREAVEGREVAEDPYQVAHLRGGRYEALHAAVVSLVERGLLKASGRYLVAEADAAARVRRPLDTAILTRFASRTPAMQGTEAEVIYSDAAILAEAGLIGEALEQRNLIPDEATKKARKTRVFLAAGFLWVVAGTKVLVALSRGKPNVLFLIVLAALVLLPLIAVSRRPRTALGDKTHRWIQALFGGLRHRRESLGIAGSNGELAFLAAAFGLAALPPSMSLVIDPLHLQPPKAAGAGSGCGSSCASFSSCGGGCGGGGCGGGCGGCG